jgi:hypothetical protein
MHPKHKLAFLWLGDALKICVCWFEIDSDMRMGVAKEKLWWWKGNIHERGKQGHKELYRCQQWASMIKHVLACTPTSQSQLPLKAERRQMTYYIQLTKKIEFTQWNNCYVVHTLEGEKRVRLEIAIEEELLSSVVNSSIRFCGSYTTYMPNFPHDDPLVIYTHCWSLHAPRETN